MPRRILLLLAQLPFDPSSGAARSMRGIAEILAASPDFEVRAVGTSGTEQGLATGTDPAASADHYARTAGAPFAVDTTAVSGHQVFRAELRGVSYAILDTGRARPHDLPPDLDAAFDALIDHTTDRWTPDIVLTFGGRAAEVNRRERLRNRGSAIVFGLRNLSYKSAGAFRHVDAVLTPSAFLSDFYRSAIGLDSTAIPSPIDLADVRAENRNPRHLTIINPSMEKGLMVFARIAHDISTRRPDISIMVVESRGTAGLLVRAGLAGGFDLRPHRNILVSPGVSRPALIYAATRVLLIPSLWAEPFGRVAVEALANAVPPIVSDRGALPGVVGDGGFTVPIPESITPRTQKPASSEDVAPWTDLAIRLMTDDAFHAEASARAAAAAHRYMPETISPRYFEFFASVVRTPGETHGPGIDPARAVATQPARR